MNLAMVIHLSAHFFTTLIVAGYLYIGNHSFNLAVISFFSGVLVDLDHLLDYFYFVQLSPASSIKIQSHLTSFFNPSAYVKATNKVFIFLHGWEYLLVLFWVGLKFGKGTSALALALVLPYFFHLVIDQVSSAGNWFSYSLIYRLLNKFDLKKFLCPN